MTYKLINDKDNILINIKKDNGDHILLIPINLANTDYTNFKKDISEGVEVQDADGNLMTSEEVEDFLKTLP